VTAHCPAAHFLDRDVARLTTSERKADFGVFPVVASFDGARVAVRRDDGAVITVSVCRNGRLFPALRERATGFAGGDPRWDEAIRVCRFAKDSRLWACLATYAVEASELETAQIAYAALEHVEKVRFIEKVRRNPNEVVRAAEMAAFKRDPKRAESLLLAAGFVRRAVELNLRVFDWDRALEIATTHGTHVDTVLFFRGEFLKQTGGKRETKPAFVAAAREVEVIEARVLAKLERERRLEETAETETPPTRATTNPTAASASKTKPTAGTGKTTSTRR
jgi:intraflagellar transport protein 80